MTVVTPTLSLTLYDSSGDQAVTFATFRAVWGGTATTSNFYRIDTWAGTVNSSITTLQNQRGAIPVPASYISANYYEATVASISSYVTNMTVLIVLDTDSNGTVTLNINALGTKSLMKVDSSGAFVNISGAELQSGRYYLFVYDGTRFVWANATSADQIYHGGTSGNVVLVASNGSVSDSTTPSTLISSTIHSATSKATPVDADELGIVDSAASNVLKLLTWANLKATLKTYFDTLYYASSNVTNTTFTPTIVGTTTAGAGTYSIQLGEYYTVGNLVFVTGNLVWSAHTGTGNMRIGSLPFTSKNNSIYAPLSIVWSGLTLSGNDYKVMVSVVPNSVEAEVREVQGGNMTLLPMDSSGTIRFAGCYIK